MVYPPTASESPITRFPTSLPWSTLHELAEQRLDYDGVASFYLSLAPTDVGVTRDRGLHEHALVDELRKQATAAEAAAGSHDRVLGLRAVPDVVEKFLASYRPAGRHIHGVAVFATPAGFFRSIELPETLGDLVAVERSPRIAPLISFVSRSHEALIAVVDHEHGELLVWAEGAARQTEEWSNDPDVVHHFKRIAEGVARATMAERRPIVLVGIEEVRGEFSRYLASAAHALVAGWISVEPHRPHDKIAAAAQPVLREWWAARERELLDSWHEAAAKHTHGVAGFEDTLEAATDGAVAVLLFQDEPRVEWPPAFECEHDGRASLTPGECPLDGGTFVRRPDGLEVVLRETLRYGGKAFATQHQDDLARAQGVGAMTRFMPATRSRLGVRPLTSRR